MFVGKSVIVVEKGEARFSFQSFMFLRRSDLNLNLTGDEGWK